jgi:hypothetical protein
MLADGARATKALRCSALLRFRELKKLPLLGFQTRPDGGARHQILPPNNGLRQTPPSLPLGPRS